MREKTEQGRKTSLERRNEAGAANLAKWKKEHPEEANKAAYKTGLGTFIANGRVPSDPVAISKATRLVKDAERELKTRGALTVRQRILLANLRIALVIAFIGAAFLEKEGIAVVPGQARSLTDVVSKYLNHARAALIDLQLDNLPEPVSVDDEIALLTEEITDARK